MDFVTGLPKTPTRNDAWDAGQHSLRQRPKIYFSILGKFAAKFGNIVAFGHCLSSPNRRVVGEDNSKVRRHATGLCN